MKREAFLVVAGLLLAGRAPAFAGPPGVPPATADTAVVTAAARPTFVDNVRNATRMFGDVGRAADAGYGAFLGCVSGPDEGAMGVHFVNPGLVGDDEIEVEHPEALIYEPSSAGYRLVAVEYLVVASAWDATHSQPPVLGGQVFEYNESPNRYGLPAFYDLHVWAWRENPKGTFAEWNPRVSCASQ